MVLIGCVMFFGTVKSSFSASSGTRTISLEVLGVVFQVPNGFSVFQWESNEGNYHTYVYFGKDFQPGHFKETPLQISFGPRTNAADYIDSEFYRIKENLRGTRPSYRDAEYVRLFGNKAVRYTELGQPQHTVIVGYLRKDQLPEQFRIFAHEYLAGITISQNAPEAGFNKAYKTLIDIVLNSIRSTK